MSESVLPVWFGTKPLTAVQPRESCLSVHLHLSVSVCRTRDM